MKSKFSHILIYQIQYVGTRVDGGRQHNGIGTERTTERIPQLQYRVPARTVRVDRLSARSGYSNLVPVPVVRSTKSYNGTTKFSYTYR